MELAQLEAFLQVAHHRSFSRAAEALFLTQPSVTARIQSLERELGERLFERSGRSVRLGRYLDDPRLLFVPARILLNIIHAFAAVIMKQR